MDWENNTDYGTTPKDLQKAQSAVHAFFPHSPLRKRAAIFKDIYHGQVPGWQVLGVKKLVDPYLDDTVSFPAIQKFYPTVVKQSATEEEIVQALIDLEQKFIDENFTNEVILVTCGGITIQPTKQDGEPVFVITRAWSAHPIF